MQVLVILVSVVYYLFVGFLIQAWRKKIPQKTNPQVREPKVSVVIAVRNESETIGCIMDSLSRQDYSADRFEVIVMDDGSTDHTSEIVQVKGKRLSCDLILGVTGADQLGGNGKKVAITRGVELAKGELILITDGDCRVEPQWISSHVKWFLDYQADFLAGPVRIKGDTAFWQRWQALEFASLVGTGAAFINAGVPLFCNGANMAFRKEVFLSSGGYGDNSHVPSGDDVYLMQKIYASGGKVVFVKDCKAIVETRLQPTWKDFFHQRNRWAGKWHHQHSWYGFLVPVMLFTYYFLLTVSVFLTIFGLFPWWLLLFLLVMKLVLEYIFLRNVMVFQGNKIKMGIFTISSLAYAFYALLFGITANLMGFQWKGRKHKRL